MIQPHQWCTWPNPTTHSHGTDPFLLFWFKGGVRLQSLLWRKHRDQPPAWSTWTTPSWRHWWCCGWTCWTCCAPYHCSYWQYWNFTHQNRIMIFWITIIGTRWFSIQQNKFPIWTEIVCTFWYLSDLEIIQAIKMSPILDFYSDSEYDDTEASSTTTTMMNSSCTADTAACHCRSCTSPNSRSCSSQSAVTRYTDHGTRYPLSLAQRNANNCPSFQHPFRYTRKIFSNHRYNCL